MDESRDGSGAHAKRAVHGEQIALLLFGQTDIALKEADEIVIEFIILACLDARKTYSLLVNLGRADDISAGSAATEIDLMCT